MITPKTQAAIAILYDIYTKNGIIRTDEYKLSEEDKHALLCQLTEAGLIYLADKDNPQNVQSYYLVKEAADIALLDILEATGEHLNCNHPTTEEFYSRYGRAAQKLGVVNHMTRLYLEEIKLLDL